MPVSKKESTTSSLDPKTPEQAGPSLPDQRTFHQHLRDQIRLAVQTVMEEVMREELTQFLGAEWGERTNTRAGHRNGTYRRDLATSSGQISDRHPFPEIEKDTSTLRHLNATAATNPKWQKG